MHWSIKLESAVRCHCIHSFIVNQSCPIFAPNKRRRTIERTTWHPAIGRHFKQMLSVGNYRSCWNRLPSLQRWPTGGLWLARLRVAGLAWQPDLYNHELSPPTASSLPRPRLFITSQSTSNVTAFNNDIGSNLKRMYLTQRSELQFLDIHLDLSCPRLWFDSRYYVDALKLCALQMLNYITLHHLILGWHWQLNNKRISCTLSVKTFKFVIVWSNTRFF